jgi:hypothetical protein
VGDWQVKHHGQPGRVTGYPGPARGRDRQDIQSPGIHVLFGLAGEQITSSLNDYLWHGRAIKATAHDVTPSLGAAIAGRVFLIPASTKPGEITRVLREGYDAQRLTQGLRQLIDELRLDTLMIDTHPGLNEETLLSLVLSHLLLVVMRPDQQDYEGTGIAVQVARRIWNATPPRGSCLSLPTRACAPAGREISLHRSGHAGVAPSGGFARRGGAARLSPHV